MEEGQKLNVEKIKIAGERIKRIVDLFLIQLIVLIFLSVLFYITDALSDVDYLIYPLGIMLIVNVIFSILILINIYKSGENLILSVTTVSEKVYQGIIKEFYPSGKLMFIKSYENGKKDGDWLSYYENGNLKSKKKFVNGIKIGEFETYFENGQIEYKGSFKDGLEEGEWLLFDESGSLIRKDIFKEGKRLN